jgi:hypothetical protein
VARNTAPTPISYTETIWTAGAGTKTTASVSWNAGDKVVVIVGCEASNSTISAVTATGLTFLAKAGPNTAASTCYGAGYIAEPVSSGSAAVTATNTNTALHWGIGVWVWRGSDGFDAACEQHTATKTKALVHTDTHSATSYATFDFQPGAAQTITPVPTNTRQRVLDGTSYTIYVSDLDDQASSGSVSYGITGGAGTGPFTIIGVAVLGTTTGGGAAAPKQLAALGVG